MVGLIGSDLLANMILEIDSKQQRITITTAEKQTNVSLRKSVSFVEEGVMPIIELQAGLGNGIKVLFDTEVLGSSV
ncbi:MAG: hypothetical protein ACLU4N_11965 [Butyricimonas faecihominis]